MFLSFVQCRCCDLRRWAGIVLFLGISCRGRSWHTFILPTSHGELWSVGGRLHSRSVSLGFSKWIHYDSPSAVLLPRRILLQLRVTARSEPTDLEKQYINRTKLWWKSSICSEYEYATANREMTRCGCGCWVCCLTKLLPRKIPAASPSLDRHTHCSYTIGCCHTNTMTSTRHSCF